MHGKEIIPYTEIIGIDVIKDILILKIQDNRFREIKIGNSSNMKIGQKVYTIGSPMGFENTISEGIISGLRNDIKEHQNLIQISASISSGSSGGAVLNDKGELIGITTFTVTEGQNINFAIPIEELLAVKIRSHEENANIILVELLNLCNKASKEGKHQESIKYATWFINKEPKYPGTYIDRGSAKLALDDYHGAIQDFTKAIELDPDEECGPIYSYFNRGLAKHMLGDYRGAIQDFTKAIKLDPGDPKTYFLRGRAKQKINDIDGACLDWSRSGELGHMEAYKYINEFCR